MGSLSSRVIMAGLGLFLLGASTVSAQTFSEREEIAIFRVSYYGQPSYDPPSGVRVEIRGRRGSLTVNLRGTGDPSYDDLFARAIGAVDEQIRSVFINLGRFDVIGMQQRLTASSVDDFIATLSEYQADTSELPEAVLLGEQAFTERDFQELVGGFIVVVPSVSWYNLRRDDSGSFQAEMQTSFTFIDVEDMRTIDQFFVETTGYDDDPAVAVREAVESLPGELSFRVRSMPQFQIMTGVLEVTGREVILEFGRNMGLEPGDEYAIVAERVLSTGHVASTETGLILIREVQEDFSYGRVLYATPRARPGDQLREVPRRGVDGGIYLDLMTDGIDLTPLIGLRATASRGFYAWRPFAAFEIPLRGLIANQLFPVNISVGTEWNSYFGRLRLTPSASLGVGGAVPLVDDPEY
ncbi:MAG TPA: hypothetical protein VKA06_02685, partial [Spirochaetia bacterium]|nr:hypothetical protein [Spirochaetia bacterium]